MGCGAYSRAPIAASRIASQIDLTRVLQGPSVTPELYQAGGI